MKKFLLLSSLLIWLLVLNGQSVLAQAVTGVTLDKHTLSLKIWASEQLTATISPSDAANKNVSWSSSNSAIISVDNSGFVSANHDGIATIYVKTEDGGFTDSCVVTCQVSNAANIVTFSFAGQSHETNISDDRLTATGFLPYGTDPSNLTVSNYQISPGATINPLPETIHDFTDTVSFVVTAPDGTTQKTWKVSVMVMPDLSGAQPVEITFNTAPQNWIDDTVSWVESDIHFHVGYPDHSDTSWPPSASVGESEEGRPGIGLFPAQLQFYLQDTSKIIVAASMYIFENCGDQCTQVTFSGESSMQEYIPKMTRDYYFYDLSAIRATSGWFGSYESEFSGITFWIANKDGSVNHPPVADAGPDQTVHAKDTVQLDGSGSFDPDQEALDYLWTAPQGISLSDSSVVTPTFIAPNSIDTLHLTFVLTVSDDLAFSADSVVITVIPTNHRPVADAGPNQTVFGNDSVYLNGTASSDPDGDPLTYLWLAPGGIHLTDSTSPTPAFKAPDVLQTTVFSFALIVNDGAVNSELDTVFITVEHKNQRPVAWFDIDSMAYYEGDTAYLDGHYSYDPDGDSLRFHWWTDPGSGIGFFDSTAMDVRCGTPMVDHDTTFKVYLKVDDGTLYSEPDTFYLRVLNVNTLPVAVLARHTASVNDGDTVYLDGSASYDADGDSLTYKWSGPKEVYLYKEGDSAWFIAPIVKKETPFIFTLVVNDGHNDSPPTADTVWVKHVNHTPVAQAGYPIEMFEGDSSYLYGSLSYDYDGDSLSYSWSVPAGFWIDDSTQPDSRFSAPQVLHDTTFNLILKVYDGQVWSAPDTCRVTVKNKNHAPVAEIVSTAQIFYGVSMNEGDTLWIDGSPSYDPDGDPITYDWALPKDFNFYHYDSVKVMVIAPEVANTTSFDAALFVSDGVLRSKKDFIIEVKNVNKAPVADAGKSFSTLSGQMEELDGSGSYDPDGDSLHYTWIAPAGTPLSDVHAVSPTFTAPQVTSSEILTFKLVVNDGYLNSDTALVEVTVLPIVATLRVSALVNDSIIPYNLRHITLYYHNNGRWEMQNVMSYNDNGETYYAVWEGEWMVTVDPAGSDAGFVTTFYGDVTQWVEANAFNVAGGSETHITINCVPVSQDLNGDGMIDGQIYRDTVTAGVARNTVARLDGARDNLVPAEGVSIFLYRSSDDALLASTLTDETGRFVFENLPTGSYYLSVQLPGFDANTPWEVEVTDTETVVDNVNFVINEADQSVTDVANQEELSVKLYPNPAKDMLYIQMNDRDAGAVIRIYDLTGHMVMSKSLENRTTRIDISTLRKGIYLLRINSYEKVVTRRIVKQ